jgi:hypothetical protein
LGEKKKGEKGEKGKNRSTKSLKVLLLAEEHRKADDGTVDKQAAEDGHDHGRVLDDAAVRQERGESYIPKSII